MVLNSPTERLTNQVVLIKIVFLVLNYAPQHRTHGAAEGKLHVFLSSALN
jgi:hypothetical protein